MKPASVAKCVGSIIKLRPEYEERYIILHRHTFPGVLARIRKSNIRNYTIFLHDGILFSYYEYVGTDYNADMEAIADPVTRDWWKLTDPMQEPVIPRKKKEWWAGMDLLMRDDNEIKSSVKAIRLGQVGQVISGKERIVKNMFKKYPDAVKEATKKEKFQKHTVYYRGGKLYLYFEYVGGSFQKAREALMKNEAFNKFRNELNKCMVLQGNTHWQMMEEVFHTD